MTAALLKHWNACHLPAMHAQLLIIGQGMSKVCWVAVSMEDSADDWRGAKCRAEVSRAEIHLWHRGVPFLHKAHRAVSCLSHDDRKQHVAVQVWGPQAAPAPK